MELKKQFEEFLKEIRPTPAQIEDYKDGHRRLTKRLKEDDVLKNIIVNTFIQGSYRRATAVRPVGDTKPDVDVVVVTNIDRTEVTAQEAIKNFVPFVEKHYSGKYKLNGRSIGITLSRVKLDLVVTALDQASEAKALAWKSVTALDSLEESPDWRFTDSWIPEDERELLTSDALKSVQAGQEWKSKPLWIPDREANEWEETNPLEQIRWTAEKNRLCNGNYVNIVKALKWWKNNNDSMPKYPKGYPFEHIIGDCCPVGSESVANGIVDTLEEITSKYQSYVALGHVPFLEDRGGSNDVLHRVTPDDFKKYYEGVTGAAKIARNALDCDDAIESAELWQDLFGSKFPIPAGVGPGGGTKGYTVPAGAAAVESTRWA